jgi:hypothetical protein
MSTVSENLRGWVEVGDSAQAAAVKWATIGGRAGRSAAFAATLGAMPLPRSPLSRLFTVLLAGLLAGLALAVAALPANLLLGWAARSALGSYEALPAALRTPATRSGRTCTPATARR